MTHFRVSLAIVPAFIMSAAAFSDAAAGASPRCTYSLAQYTEYAKVLEPFIDRVRQIADDNPLHESDAQFYAAELGGVRACIKTLTSAKNAVR
jgi:hypothetical protein